MTVYLRFKDRPGSFKAPFCDCTETCPECFREGRVIGLLTPEERTERIARMEVRMGHAPGALGEVSRP